jgi:prevent-host-death family protein
MERVTIANLKNRLRAYLRKVRAGEPIVVLDRNRPAARLEPIKGREAAADRLEAAGIVRRGRKPWRPGLLKPKADLPRSKRSVLGALLEDRTEDR